MLPSISPVLNVRFAREHDRDREHLERLRVASKLAIVALIFLNFLDITLTKAFLAEGFTESNVLMRGVVGDWRMTAVKFAIITPLALRVWRRRPTVPFACMLWTAVGWYVLAAYVNWQVLQSV